jgi:hypothetical protein
MAAAGLLAAAAACGHAKLPSDPVEDGVARSISRSSADNDAPPIG